MESNLYAQLQGSCTLGRDMGFQPGPHATIPQFENTDATGKCSRWAPFRRAVGSDGN